MGFSRTKTIQRAWVSHELEPPIFRPKMHHETAGTADSEAASAGGGARAVPASLRATLVFVRPTNVGVAQNDMYRTLHSYSLDLSIYLSTYLPTYLSIYLPTYLSIYLYPHI